MKLVIGNKNYSTWSLRPWLLLKHFDVAFDEVQESLKAEGLSERLAVHSPSKRVPVLIDSDLHIWDSLAICEYVSEQYLDGGGWPADAAQRARARAISAEMHAGFNALRSELPMNLRARRKVTLSDAAQRDIARIDELWSSQLNDVGGPYLFGDFSIADCMYAPVALRFPTYGIELGEQATAYQQTLIENPSVREWVAAGLKETEIVEEDETGEDIS